MILSHYLPEWCVALCAYHGKHWENELSFEEGQRIKILKRDHPDWWTGEVTDGTGGVLRGIFPRNYVEEAHDQASVSTDVRDICPKVVARVEQRIRYQFLDIFPMLIG